MTLSELQGRARADLGNIRTGVLLEWTFEAARAAGRVAEVTARLRFMEEMHRAAWMAYPNAPDAKVETVIGAGFSRVELDQVRAELQEATACADAARSVVKLIERRLAKGGTRAKVQAVQAARKAA